MNLWNQKFRTWGVFVACFVLVLAGLVALEGRFTPVVAGMVLQQADMGQEDTDVVDEDSSTESTSDVVVHRLNLGGSNGYLLETPEGLILVDAGIPFSHLIVQRKMNEIGRDDLKLIYITHAHIDHYGGANALREATGAPIAIHRADAESMAQGRTELGTVRDWKKTSDRTLPWIEPLLTLTPTEADILLEDGDSLEEYGINAYVLHTPGHTPGSSTLILDDHIAFVGDLLASNGKVHAQRSFANDWLEVARSLARLREVGPDVIYPGHGSEPIKSGQLDDVDANFVE
jgi:hydroxyacylglutathione hydrolase